jgi:hypothetical protein
LLSASICAWFQFNPSAYEGKIWFQSLLSASTCTAYDEDWGVDELIIEDPDRRRGL